MECRNTFGAIPSRSYPSLTGGTQSQPQPQRHYRGRPRRLFDCENDEDDNNNNNNSNVSAETNIMSATTTSLMDELEQLRTDNFQLRLRVYNAERRVDMLSAAAATERTKRDREEKCDYSMNEGSDSDSDASSSNCSSSENISNNDAAAARATAEAAVRTIHDLLTVNRRLLALLAATVSAKAIAVTAADKRRWKRLQNHINDFGGGLDEEDKMKMERKQLDDNDESDMSVSDSESCTARNMGKSTVRESTVRRVATLLPPSPPPSTTHEPDKRPTAAGDDDSAGSELSRLRARCRRLERSLQQLVNTELWARNRQIGKLEQQRYMSQIQAADTTEQKDRPSVIQRSRGSDAPPTMTKGILVMRSPTPVSKTPAELSATAITTPPSVLPDYSEVNFFFSCDEEDDDGDENCSDSNVTSLSAEEQTDSGDDECGQESVHTVQQANAVAVTTPSANCTKRPVVRRSQKRRRTRPQQILQSSGHQSGVVETATTWSSSTESLTAVTDDMNGVTTTAAAPSPKRSRRRRRTLSGRSLQHKPRPRWKPTHQCKTCGRSSSGDSVQNRPPTTTRVVVDAQVQCGYDTENDAKVNCNNNCNDNDAADEDQLLLLRRELDVRRRENYRLYDMLLKLQRARGTRKIINGEDGSGDPDLLALADLQNTIDNSSDRGGSPEPYRQAACAVRSRIAELLPPLLSTQSASVGSPLTDVNAEVGVDHASDLPLNNVLEQQQQQQLLLLTRLRERIVAYERRELQLDGSDSKSVSSATAVTDTAINRMNRAELVNVALPRTVDRLRQVLMPLIQQQRAQSLDKQTDEQQMK